ncbi:hypothetical protein MMC17_007896 [Xylographa soralifera]|nr:hypothetical protein [Xylographa soralifera]
MGPIQQEGLWLNQPSNSRMVPVLSNESPPSADQSIKGRRAGRQRLQSWHWEKHRNAIKRLYVDEDKTLAATRQVMKDEHGFDASEKAYKAQFQEWNWEKNLKKPITDFIHVKEEQRKSQGKTTTFIYRGSTISKARLNRICKRMANVDTKTYSEAIIKTPRGLSYHTPIPSSNRRLLSNRTCSVTGGVDPESFAAWLGLINGPQGNDPFHRLEQAIFCWTGTPGHSTISLRNFELYESASCVVDAAIQECIIKCRSSDGMSSAIKFFDDPLLLSKRRIHDGRCIVWADYEFVTLPVLYCKTLCLAAAGRYNESEVLMDKLLERHSRCIKDKSTQYFRKIVPMIILLSKIYIAQGKFYVLKKLVSGTLSDTRSLHGLENETWMLHQILYAAMMFELYPKGATNVRFSVDRLEKQVLTNLLASAVALNTPSNLQHHTFILGALELLRSRCWHFHGAAANDLSAILVHEQAVLGRALNAMEDTDVDMVLVAANGLVESLHALQNDGQAQFWERKLAQIHSTDGWKHRPSAAEIPVYKTLERYVEQEWPFVPLIRSRGSEVPPVCEMSASLFD